MQRSFPYPLRQLAKLVFNINHQRLYLFIFGFDQSLPRDAMMIQVSLNTIIMYMEITPRHWKCINPIQIDFM